jgi:PTS system maltose and glucose-specific IIC component
MSVNDMSLVDDAKLKANGALGVIKLDEHNLQVVIGTQVHLVKNEMQALMSAS